jgi:hypothetical protein
VSQLPEAGLQVDEDADPLLVPQTTEEAELVNSLAELDSHLDQESIKQL